MDIRTDFDAQPRTIAKLLRTMLALLLGLAAAGCFGAAAWWPFMEQIQEAEPGVLRIADPLQTEWVKISIWILAGVVALFALLRLFFTYWLFSLGSLAAAALIYWQLFLVILGQQPPEVQAAHQIGLGLWALAGGGMLLLVGAALAPRKPRYAYPHS